LGRLGGPRPLSLFGDARSFPGLLGPSSSPRGTRAPYGEPVLTLGTRRKAQPAPVHVLREALCEPNRDPARRWLVPLDDEVVPAVLEAEERVVVWSSLWVKRPEAQIRFDLEEDGQGSLLRWTLLDVDDPGPALLGHMCKRVQQLINGELRYSFGQ
jgi:hypothetical protein